MFVKQERDESRFLVLRRAVFSLAFAVTSVGCAAQAETAKKYPPYPDVWGYELPYPEEHHRDARLGVYRMENGDVFVSYVKHRVTSLRKDGTCCDFKSSYAGFYFFSREKHNMTTREFNAFGQQHRANRVGFRDYEKIILKDGDSISRGGTTHSRCYVSFPYYLVKKDSRGEVIARKSLLYLRDTPRERPINPYCEGAGGLSRIHERVDSGVFNLVPLADNTFLVFEPYGNLIIRLDDNLNTKFQDPHVFLVDTEIIENMAKKLAEEGEYNNQTINDAVARYLQGLKRGE